MFLKLLIAVLVIYLYVCIYIHIYVILYYRVLLEVSHLRFIFVLFINIPIRGNLHTLHT